MMQRCKVCGSPVPNHKERRLLEGTSSSSVRNGLLQLSKKVELKASICDDHFSHGYICKKCFILVEKCVSLTNKLIELEKTITSNLQSAIGQCEPQEGARGTKRYSCSSHGTSTPKRMRIENNASSSVVVKLFKDNYA